MWLHWSLRKRLRQNKPRKTCHLRNMGACWWPSCHIHKRPKFSLSWNWSFNVLMTVQAIYIWLKRCDNYFLDNDNDNSTFLLLYYILIWYSNYVYLILMRVKWLPEVLTSIFFSSGKTSLLFQAALSYSAEDLQVMFVCSKPWVKMPLCVHGMPRPDSSILRLLKFQ